jgi:hypothetical protein
MLPLVQKRGSMFMAWIMSSGVGAERPRFLTRPSLACGQGPCRDYRFSSRRISASSRSKASIMNFREVTSVSRSPSTFV